MHVYFLLALRRSIEINSKHDNVKNLVYYNKFIVQTEIFHIMICSTILIFINNDVSSRDFKIMFYRQLVNLTIKREKKRFWKFQRQQIERKNSYISKTTHCTVDIVVRLDLVHNPEHRTRRNVHQEFHPNLTSNHSPIKEKCRHLITFGCAYWYIYYILKFIRLRQLQVVDHLDCNQIAVGNKNILL